MTEKLFKPYSNLCKGTQTSESHDDFMHYICGISGNSYFQCGRHDDSDGKQFYVKGSWKLAYYAGGCL